MGKKINISPEILNYGSEDFNVRTGSGVFRTEPDPEFGSGSGVFKCGSEFASLAIRRKP